MVSPFVFSVFFVLGYFFWALPLLDLINFRLLLVSPSVDTCGIFLFAIFVEQGVVYLVLPALKHSYFINPVILLLYCYWRKVMTRFCCCCCCCFWGVDGVRGRLRFWFLLLLLPFCLPNTTQPLWRRQFSVEHIYIYIRLTLTEYCAYIIEIKANKALGFLRRSLKISASIKLNIRNYKVFVRPLLEYAASVWDPYSHKNIAKIEAVQRRAAHFVLNRGLGTPQVSTLNSSGRAGPPEAVGLAYAGATTPLRLTCTESVDCRCSTENPEWPCTLPHPKSQTGPPPITSERRTHADKQLTLLSDHQNPGIIEAPPSSPKPIQGLELVTHETCGSPHP